MTITSWKTLLIAVLFAAAACGDDDEGGEQGPGGGVEPPENPSRELPTLGPSDGELEEAPTREPYVPEDPDLGQEIDDECCPVSFALAPRIPEQVVDVVLRGSASPLDTAAGVALVESDGVWSAEVCIAPDYVGSYHYDVGLQTTSGEPLRSVRYNRFAPTTEAAGEVVNGWIPADDCASLDGAIHGKTSE